MKTCSSIVAAIAAFVVALMVVPPGTAGAAPSVPIHTPNLSVTAAGDSQSLTVHLRNGVFRQVGDELQVVDASGAVTEQIPLTVATRGKTGSVRAVVAGDRKSVRLAPLAGVRHQASAAKDRAWNNMAAQANRDWPCAAGYIGGGALIGLLVGLLIFGWITVPIGAAIGAYVGYTTCNHGATWRAAVKWWNTP